MAMSSLSTAAAIHRKFNYKLKFTLNQNTIQHPPTLSFFHHGNTIGDITWTDPNGGVSHEPVPSSSFLQLPGDYTLECKNWAGFYYIDIAQQLWLGASHDSMEADVNQWDFRYFKNITMFHVYAWSFTGDTTKYNISECKELVDLRLGGYQLNGKMADMHLERLTKLEDLSLSGRNDNDDRTEATIADLNLQQWPMMQNFNVGIYKNLTGNIEDWTIGSCPNLKTLTLDHCDVAGNLGIVDFSQCPALITIGMDTLKVTNINGFDLSNNTNLTQFIARWCYSMAGDISTIKLPDSLLYFDVFNATPLSGNVANIDVSNCLGLTIFGFSNTNVSGNIEDLDLSNNSAMTGWGWSSTLIGGDISAIDISHMSELTWIQMDGRRYSQDPATHLYGEFTDGIDPRNHPKLRGIVVRDQYFMDFNLNALDISQSLDFQDIYADRTSGFVGDIALWDVKNHPKFDYFAITGTSLSGDFSQNKLPDHMWAMAFDSITNTMTGDLANIDFSRFYRLNSLGIMWLRFTGSYSDLDTADTVVWADLGSYGNVITDITAWNVPHQLKNFNIRQYFDYSTTGLFLSDATLLVNEMRWEYCGLTTQSIDNILSDLASSGRSGGRIILDHNNPPSAAGLQSRDALVSRGWQVFLDS